MPNSGSLITHWVQMNTYLFKSHAREKEIKRLPLNEASTLEWMKAKPGASSTNGLTTSRNYLHLKLYKHILNSIVYILGFSPFLSVSIDCFSCRTQNRRRFSGLYLWVSLCYIEVDNHRCGWKAKRFLVNHEELWSQLLVVLLCTFL